MKMQGRVIWITGLSGAGKSTLANVLVEDLRARDISVISLDGDILREVLGSASSTNQHQTASSRLALAWQYARLCKMLADQGFTVVIATISMFHEIHAWNRAHLPGYFEVFLDVPLEVRRRRDPKGIYQRFDRGEITHVAGLDLPVEPPLAPDLLVRFDPSVAVATVAERLRQCLYQNEAEPS